MARTLTPARHHFPTGFRWGGAFAAHQMEGAWREGGKGVNVTDVSRGLLKAPSLVWNETTQKWEPALDGYFPSHEAIDLYHRFEGTSTSWPSLG